jgi:ATPase associated with various cellular activities AAA_3
MCVSMGYPTEADEAEIITAQKCLIHPVENINAVVSKDDIISCMEEAVDIHVDEAVLKYLIDLTRETRKDSRIAAGVSPRGSVALYKACQAYAAIKGRGFVTPEDIKHLAKYVFRKRLILTTDSILKSFSVDNMISELIDRVPLPDFKAHL